MFTDYAVLKATLADWLDRTDLTDRIPDFIALAEAKLNRDLRIRAMEARSVAPVSGEYLALPPGFMSARRLKALGNPPRTLQYMTPEVLDDTYRGNPGLVQAFTVHRDEIQFGPVPSETVQVEMVYYQRITPLGADNPSNWFLTHAPDVLLYGSLLEAAAFLADDPRMNVWKPLYENAITDLIRQDKRDRHSGSALVVRS